jgi:hypothetical protein
MKIKPKFIQFSCIEGDKIDLRQANSILKYKPDIIIFEMPQGKNGSSIIFNKYSCDKKPLNKVRQIIQKLKISAKKYPYAASDIMVWNNIMTMWRQNINTQIYNVDTPDEFRREPNLFNVSYPAVRQDWFFWVYLYIRDSFMVKNIQKVLVNYQQKENPTILIFLQSIHWKNVQFLLKSPSKKDVWKYYFGRFKNIKPTKDLDKKIKLRNLMVYKYWKQLQK